MILFKINFSKLFQTQFVAIEFFKLLMDYSVKDELLKQLVDLLKPVKRMDKPAQIIESELLAIDNY